MSKLRNLSLLAVCILLLVVVGFTDESAPKSQANANAISDDIDDEDSDEDFDFDETSSPKVITHAFGLAN